MVSSFSMFYARARARARVCVCVCVCVCVWKIYMLYLTNINLR